YAFNKFVAIEAGFMGLPRARITHLRLNNNQFDRFRHRRDRFDDHRRHRRFDFGFPGHGNFNRSIDNYAFDISGKISVLLPNSENVGLFAKAGVGFLQSRFKHRDDNNNNWWGFGGFRRNHHHHHRGDHRSRHRGRFANNNFWGWGNRDDDNTRSNTN